MVTRYRKRRVLGRGLASIFPPGSLAVLGRRMMARSGAGRRKRRPRRTTGRGIFGKALGIGGSLADALGFGRRRRKRPVRRVRRVGRPRSRRVSGRGLWSTIKSIGSKVHNFAKKHSLVSRGLSSLGYNRASSMAKIAGYGRARSSRRVVRF